VLPRPRSRLAVDETPAERVSPLSPIVTMQTGGRVLLGVDDEAGGHFVDLVVAFLKLRRVISSSVQSSPLTFLSSPSRLPVTHTPSSVPELAVEFPAASKRRRGLDDERSRVVLSKANHSLRQGPTCGPQAPG
jgi:hypothetical protein